MSHTPVILIRDKGDHLEFDLSRLPPKNPARFALKVLQKLITDYVTAHGTLEGVPADLYAKMARDSANIAAILWECPVQQEQTQANGKSHTKRNGTEQYGTTTAKRWKS